MSGRNPGPDQPAGAEFVAGARVVRLLADLVDSGPAVAVHDAWQAFPELADLWPGTGDADGDAAVHQEVFGFNLLPYAGVFLDDADGEGQAPDEVAHRYRSAGFAPDSDDLRPDHLATELRFLAWLLERGPRGAADAAAFLDGHLLAWLPALVFAAGRGTAYGPSLEFLLAWILDQRRRIGERLGPGLPDGPVDLRPAAPVLGDERTGVRDIAAFLTTPVRSGFHVGRRDIASLSRETGAPGGFGGRRLMMENLLRSAALYDGIGPLFDRLDALAGDTADRWGELAGAPGAGPWAAVWRERITGTRQMLGEMRDRLDEDA